MAVKPILTFPEFAHILKIKSEPVRFGDSAWKPLVDDLRDTVLAAENAVGLAAPQIGALKRVFVLKKSYVKNDIDARSVLMQSEDPVLVFINPKIISLKGVVREEEGCLSVPRRCIKIERAKTVKLRACGVSGKQFYERFQGLAARAVQQEMDHLNGVLILDYQQGEEHSSD